MYVVDENWTWYALHYSSAGKAANSDETNYCKLIPKVCEQWITFLYVHAV